MKRFLALLLSGLMLGQPLAVLAADAAAIPLVDSRGFAIDNGFDPNAVLTDDDIYSVSGMTRDRLLAFVDTKGGLADVSVPDIDGVVKSAADVIWRVANTYKLNPKFLLALLQKEQSLVEASAPTQRQLDWATGYGVCDSCAKDDPSIQDFKGFANQLEYAAKQMRERNYIRLLANGQTLSGYAPGKTVVIDGISVTPVNIATASLYSYTPHIHGNQNLWRIWQRWFSRNFPDGTLVRGEPSGQLWWIRLGQKRPFASEEVAETLVDTSKAVAASDTELAAYEDASAINFPNYALLKNPQGQIWLLVDHERRHILNMEAFRAFGFNMDEVQGVSDDDLAAYDVSEPITPDTAYPQGMLLKDATTKDIWYAENGKRYHVENAALIALYFRNRTAKSISSAALAELQNVGPYQIHDGELVKAQSASSVYVMEHGVRRPIPSPVVFEGLGWAWKNIVVLPDATVTSYPLGVPVLLDVQPTQLATN